MVMAYKGIYFQKHKEDASVKESLADFGIWCKDFPFRLFGDVKDPVSTDWPEEDGADEYVPEVLRMKAYDVEVEFGYKGGMDSANVKIRAFLDYLTGRDGTGVEMKVYDSYTKIGRQRVRLSKVSDDAFVRNEGEGDVVVFNATFRVNDPVTDIILSK